MIFGTIQRVIRRHSAFRQQTVCWRNRPLRLSPSSSIRLQTSFSREHSSKMSYQIEERGAPNTMDYKLYISKSSKTVSCVRDDRIFENRQFPSDSGRPRFFFPVFNGQRSTLKCFVLRPSAVFININYVKPVGSCTDHVTDVSTTALHAKIPQNKRLIYFG